MPPKLSRDQILEDIETLYKRALANDKWQVALRAKELQSKILGLFHHQDLPKIARIKDMTEEQLNDFIAYLEENDPDLKLPELSIVENS